MFECFHCLQRSVVWQSDFSFEDYGMDGEGIVHVPKCGNCGATIEYFIPMSVESESAESVGEENNEKEGK